MAASAGWLGVLTHRVQHLVAFVNNEVPHRPQLQVALLNQLQQRTRGSQPLGCRPRQVQPQQRKTTPASGGQASRR